MKPASPRRSSFLCFLLFACSASLASSQTVDPDTLIGTVDARIDQVFQADSGDPYSLKKVRGSLGSDRPYFARNYSWSVVAYAARCFYLNESLSQANARLQQNARYYLRELTAADKAEILPSSAENNTNTYARIVDRDSLHWHADVVLRLIEMYGTNGTVAPGRMDAATEAKCLEPIWHYVRLVSRLEKADYQNTTTWHLWESENHHAQSFSLAWQFSKIAKDLPDYHNRTYDDGSTPGELYEAWNEYFVEYVRERFRKGIFVEMLSMSYNGESIRGIYNFHDFGDAEVREHARMYLDLYFAYWAQEQFYSVPGGGRSRTTLKNSLSTHKGVAGKLAYIYFNLSNRPSVDGGIVNALLSDYRPPSVVADIATDVVGRGTYEVRQAAQGLGGAARTNWDQSRADLVPYTLNTNGGGIQRYTYCDPAFIMGTPMVEARPASDWTAISSQSRWQGAVFSGGAEEARIVPLVLPTSESHVGNAYWTVQSKGSMITQMLTTHQGGERMWAWISKAGLTDPVEESGIVFVEADAAYAAIRPVGTGYTLIEDYNFSSINPSSHWIVQPNDKFKPLILEVMAKDEVTSFQSFKNLVQANSPALNSGLLTYTTIYGDVLTMDTNYGDTPTIDGEPVDYTPARSYDSPFLYGDYNGETFTIEKGTRREVYNIPSGGQIFEDITVLDKASNLESAEIMTNTLSGFIVPSGTTGLKLILTASWENADSSISAVWNGSEPFQLAEIAQYGRNAAILYLDDPSPGTGDIVVSFGAGTGSLVSAMAVAGAQQGVSLTHSEDSGATGEILTTVGDSLVVGAYTTNGNSGSITGPFANSLHQGNSGSSRGNSGYQLEPTWGNKTFTWAGSNLSADAHALAEFLPLPPLPVDLKELDVPLSVVMPTIDGFISPGEWGDAFPLAMQWPELGQFPNVGGLKYTAPTDASDLSATVYYKYDSDYLYYAARVTDADFIAPPPGAGYPDDHMLVCLDPDVTTVGTGTLFLCEFFYNTSNQSDTRYRSDVAEVDSALDTLSTGDFSVAPTTSGYDIEIRFKWTDLKKNPAYTATIGDQFGAHNLLIDNDDADGTRDTFLWSSGEGQSGAPVTPELYHLCTLTGPRHSYINWIRNYNDLAGVLGQTSPRDGDRLDIDGEYFFGGNPLIHDAMEVLTFHSIDRENDDLHLSYNRRIGWQALGIDYAVKATESLGLPDWNSNGITEIGCDPVSDEIERVTVSIPMEGASRFMRVEASGTTLQ